MRQAADLLKWPFATLLLLLGATWYVRRPPDWLHMEPSTMREADLDRAVRDLLTMYGLKAFAYHTRDSRGSEPGFPDWVIAGRDRVLFRELKASDGRVSRAQRRWLDRLGEAGQDAAVWRPEDLRSGRISKELAALLA